MTGFPALMALALAACSGPAPAQNSFSGRAQARDGDSLEVGGRRVRLFGVDAPELDQRCTRAGQAYACGTDSQRALARLVDGQAVTCTTVTIDKHQRAVARCRLGQTDINRWLVAQGHATAYRRYSADYVADETAARAARRGLWAGEFQAPEQRRIDTGVATRPGDPPRPRSPSRGVDASAKMDQRCPIKGNINAKGNRWYHVPGMRFYDQVRAEHMFCSEAAAQQAGFRRAPD